MLQFAYFVSYLIVAPPMGMLMRKVGYKIGIHIGLGIFATGERHHFWTCQDIVGSC